MTARRCAVLGSPIAHSLSPLLHRTAYGLTGLDWTYDPVEVDEAGLGGFLDGLDASWRGLSLTMPLKRRVVPLLDDLDEVTALSGVANTVVLDEGRRHGHNTDVPGARDALLASGATRFDRAVVLGGGATAASVLLALADLGCVSAGLRVRDPARAGATLDAVRRHPRAPRLDVDSLDAAPVEADVLVSTVPARAQTPDVLARWVGVPLVFEVVYDPWPTPLAAAALADGRTLVDGLDLLVAQAVRQLALMAGLHDLPVAALKAAAVLAVSHGPVGNSHFPREVSQGE